MLGSFYHKSIKISSFSKLVDKIWTYFFGTADLHSHIRFRAFSKYLQHTEKNIEIGAGDGIMSFQFYLKTGKKIRAVSYEEKDYQKGLELRKKTGLKGVTFLKGDALKLSGIKRNYYDQCLLIDVLEHVSSDKLALKKINRILKNKGYFIISVPTPRYNRDVSRHFAEIVGHVREGYYIKDLQKLLISTGFKVLDYHYYTKRIASRVCYYFYGGNLEKNKGSISSKLYNFTLKSKTAGLRRLARILKRISVPVFYLISMLDNFDCREGGSSLTLLSQKYKNV